jgi:hypothetical protein
MIELSRCRNRASCGACRYRYEGSQLGAASWPSQRARGASLASAASDLSAAPRAAPSPPPLALAASESSAALLRPSPSPPPVLRRTLSNSPPEHIRARRANAAAAAEPPERVRLAVTVGAAALAGLRNPCSRGRRCVAAVRS